MSYLTARRTVTVSGLGRTLIVATYPGGGAPYIDLHWHAPYGPVLEVINVYDYRAGKVQDNLSVSAELTRRLKGMSAAELANYYRHTT